MFLPVYPGRAPLSVRDSPHAIPEGGLLPRLVGVTEAAGTPVETDPRVSLMVKWNVPRRESWLRLYLKDPTADFVELNVDPGTKALVNFTLIDLPRPAARSGPWVRFPGGPGPLCCRGSAGRRCRGKICSTRI